MISLQVFKVGMNIQWRILSSLPFPLAFLFISLPPFRSSPTEIQLGVWGAL